MGTRERWTRGSGGSLALTVALATVLAARAQDGGAEAAEDAKETVPVATIMAKPAEWAGRTVSVSGRVKSTDQTEDKESFQLILEGGLRARLSRGPIEAKYAEMKVQCVSSSKGAVVRLSHPDVKEAKANLFSSGDQIVLSGRVASKGTNRVWLDEARILTYTWPKISGHYHDKEGRCHDYGVRDGNPYAGHGGALVTARRGSAAADAAADLPQAAAADIVAKPTDFDGKRLRVAGSVQRLDAGDDKEGFTLILSGGLRCRMRRAEVETQYAGFTYHGGMRLGSGNGTTPWQMLVSKDGAAKLVRSERSSGSKNRSQVVIFSENDPIEVTGTVKRVSANRILLEDTAISRYRWPATPDGY